MSEKKFSEEEMKQLRAIQQKYFDIQSQFGKIKIAKINLNNQLNEIDNLEEDLEKQFSSNRETEENFVDDITKKYGDGQLNLETGTFIPSNKNK